MLRVIREVQPRWIVGENVLGLVNWSGGLVFEEVQADLEAQGYEVQAYVLPAAAVNAPHRRDRVWFVAYKSGKRLEREKWKTSKGEGFISESNASPNPNSNGQHECNCNDEINTSEARQYAQRDTCKISDNESIIEHSNSFRQKWRMQKDESKISIGQQSCKRNAWSIESTRWQNFPTVSPVHFRDDGLSHRLDSITFSKWRNESIKAAGNAVVPQVVYEIFKAIEKYENKFC